MSDHTRYPAVEPYTIAEGLRPGESAPRGPLLGLLRRTSAPPQFVVLHAGDTAPQGPPIGPLRRAVPVPSMGLVCAGDATP